MRSTIKRRVLSLITKKRKAKGNKKRVWRSKQLPYLRVRNSKGWVSRVQHQKKKDRHGIDCWHDGDFEYEHGHHHGCGTSKIKHVATPDCDRRIQLRLAGLTGNLNFQLFRKIGRHVLVEVECGEHTSTVRGIVCQVGPDFLDIRQKNGTIITVLRNRIIKIKWAKKSWSA